MPQKLKTSFSIFILDHSEDLSCLSCNKLMDCSTEKGTNVLPVNIVFFLPDMLKNIFT